MPQIPHQQNQHSEEAAEILGRIPSWTIRWGITVIFAIFVAIIIGCCFVKYPDKVVASIVITTENSTINGLPEGEILTGIALLPKANFGKVQQGQQVNIKLDGYPYMEYGMLTGVTGAISVVEQGNNLDSPQHTVAISFPNGIVSTYGKELLIHQKIGGTAEIITADRTLIMRFLEPIIALFEGGR